MSNKGRTRIDSGAFTGSSLSSSCVVLASFRASASASTAVTLGAALPNRASRSRKNAALSANAAADRSAGVR
jgi:hypothetical protein